MDKINLAYFTSLRESIGDEGVSTEVIDTKSGFNYGYRTGNLESMALDMVENNSKFSENFQIVMIFSDDTQEEFNDVRQFVSRWPFEIKVPVKGNGTFSKDKALEELLVTIPSQPWRKIKNRDEKAYAKQIYEEQIFIHLIRNCVDLVILDSYMPIIGPTLLDEYGGRILNIHPAITNKHSPYKLPGNKPTRDAYTRANYGFVIVDDKNATETWPEGETVIVQYDGKPRRAVQVPRMHITGVTVHVVDELIDHGSVVKDGLHYFYPGITPEGIRQGNYELKRSLLPTALLEYVQKPEIKELIMQKRQILYSLTV